MKKALAQLIILLALFFGVWFILSKVNWVKILQIEKAGKSTEEKLGDLLWKNIRSTEKELIQDSIRTPVESLFKRICEKNGIAPDSIRIEIIQKDDINAFALPGNRIIVFSGLIKNCNNEAELSGVLGHELAHIQKGHIMKKLVKEFGFSVLVTMTAGSKGSDMLQDALHKLASSAYSRELESEADKTAVDYLITADIDPAPFADFLYRISAADSTSDRFSNLIATHPASKERSEAIAYYLKDKKYTSRNVLPPGRWELLRVQVQKATSGKKDSPY